ncbi:MAG TPA: NADH:flavin oxidoreductase/NADH oxidase [Terriglobales bacterium]|nr:NADH:flavin oxidoreductase/NADH oxidase [Terriglobales bacterium]
MPHLFEPLTLRGVTFRNRIGISPMCEYSSHDGFANDWHLVHLGSRAVGGAGLVMTEASAVTPDGRISPADLGIYKNEHIEMLARIFHFIEKQGAVPGMQLAHAGRKASTGIPWEGGKPIDPASGGWTPIFAPSALPFDAGYQNPQALTIDEIASIVQAFADAAKRVLQAGGKVVEIHGAHGYLVNTFLSPLSNHRTDNYGGTFQNRARFLTEIVNATRKVWPDTLPLFVRLSSTDWADGGWTIDDSVELARTLKPLGVDLIDCSSGGLVPNAKIPVGAGYQVPFSTRIRHDANIPTAAVGMITQAAQADQIIRNGEADIVLLARQSLRDPYFPLHAASEVHFKDQKWPDQYLRGKS